MSDFGKKRKVGVRREGFIPANSNRFNKAKGTFSRDSNNSSSTSAKREATYMSRKSVFDQTKTVSHNINKDFLPANKKRENTRFQKTDQRSSITCSHQSNSYSNPRGTRTFSQDDLKYSTNSFFSSSQRRTVREGHQKEKRRFNSGKRRIVYQEENFDPNKPIRLNKYLANAGVCSRRDADKYITAGVVTVNGEVITELGHKVLRSDIVLFHDQQIKAEKKIYVLLNKPKGYVTTSEDPQNRKTVMDLVRNACMERIYPVGRLDRNTTGVLLLTNDGEMASKLTHPKFLKKKIYHVFLDRNVSASDLHQIANGVTLEDGEIYADAIDYADPSDKKQVGIEIHSGKNRIVRRIFASLGYNVIKLDRVYFAGLTKKNVKRGDWRYLSEDEVRMLRMGAFE